MPGVLYLAIKYFATPARALSVNAELSGDNCHRGSLLGAILGCAGTTLPAHLRTTLHDSTSVADSIVRQRRHHFWTIFRAFVTSTPPHTRHVLHSTWYLC